METIDLFLRFGTALLIGILIGLQREYALGEPDQEIIAGVRTFALISLFGCTAAFLADLFGSFWVFIGAVLPLGLLLATAYGLGVWKLGEIGLTTEVAALLTLLVGALCFWNQLAAAAAIGVAATVLLALKIEFQTFVRQISREDIYATLRFAVITAIILPVLPNTTFGVPPLDILNPFQIWLMVVLISGISFLGYILIKIVGAARGIGLTGFLGGIVSSTAVTLSIAQRSRRETGLARPFAFAVTIAWTMMFSRVVIEVAVLNAPLLRLLWPPLAAAGAAGLLYGAYLYFSQRVEDDGEIVFKNPFELWTAIKFGLLFATVLLISRAAQVFFGDTGIYVSSLAVGLADVDAIALSMAQLSSRPGGVDLQVAERAIVLAAMSNTAAKGGIVLAVGTPALRRTLAAPLLLILSTGIGVAFLL